MSEASASGGAKFVCPRCHHESSCKGNLIKHLTKKNLCPTLHDTTPREDIVKSLTRVSEKPKTFQCEYCDKAFSTIQGKCQHKKICPKHPDKEVKNMLISMQAKIDALEQELKMQKTQSNTGVVNNTNTTNHIQNQQIIVVNNFGQETMPDFSSEFLNYCIMNPTKGLTNIIEKIHYNRELPQNYNLRHKSVRNGTMEKYNDRQWHECDASNTLDELIRKGWRILSKHYSDMVNNPDWEGDERMYEKFMFLGDKKSMEYNAVKRDLRLLVKDRTLYLLAEQDAHLEDEELQELNDEIEDSILSQS